MTEDDTGPATWFTASEREGLVDFWRVHEACFDELTVQISAVVAGDAALTAALSRPGVADRRRHLHALVLRGIDGDWTPFEEGLRQTAAEYAQAGVTFGAWHLVLDEVGQRVTPRLVDAYASDTSRLKAALRALGKYIDRSRMVLADEFLLTQQRVKDEPAMRKEVILEAAQDAIVSVDPRGCIVDFNRAAETMFGQPRSAAVGRPVVDVLVPPRHRAAFLELFSAFSERRDGSLLGLVHEVDVATADGSEVRAEVVVGRVAGDAEPVLVAFIRDVTRERVAIEALADSERRLRGLAARLQSAIEDERTRIAREVHDELGQQLTALRLDLAFVLRRIQQGGQGEVVERIEAMIDLVDATIVMVQRLATRLRPGVLDLGLVPTIEWQAREFSARSGIAVDLELPDDVEVAPDHATALFRVLQELLTNVARHAEAEHVTISFARRSDDLVLEVLDDGRGITPEQAASATSLGLVGMRERVGIFSGRVAFRRSPAGGTIGTATIPLAAGAS